MSPLCIIIIFAVVAILFPVLAFFLFRIKLPPAAPTNVSADLIELKSSIRFLYTALPTLIFILGALGVGSYSAIVDKATTEVLKTEKIKEVKEEINIMKQEVEGYQAQANNATQSILKMREEDENKIKEIIKEELLPKGTIIPFSGSNKNLDSLIKTGIWAICDGKNGTPDLRDRFILGAPVNVLTEYRRTYNDTWVHDHKFSVRPDSSSRIMNVQPGTYPHGITFRISYYTFEKDSTSEEIYMPPYYRLVFIMKIQ